MLVFVMAQHVGIAVVGSDTKVQSFRPIPLVIDSLNENHSISEPELDRPLIRFVAGIRFNAKLHDFMVTLAASMCRMP